MARKACDLDYMDIPSRSASVGSPLRHKNSQASTCHPAKQSDITCGGSTLSLPEPREQQHQKKRFFSALKEWINTSEPSAQALKQHRKDVYRMAGISPKDPEANVKLQAPIGDIPKDAIKPATGPAPEEAAKKKAAQKRSLRGGREASRSFPSYSSRSASVWTTRDSVFTVGKPGEQQ